MPPSLKILVCCLVATWGPLGLHRLASADELFTRTEDVIYRRKHGTVLTLDVFAPRENANRAALVLIISGAWRSSHDNIRPPRFVTEYVRRGYTVFAVVHGSSPRFAPRNRGRRASGRPLHPRSRAEAYNFDGDRIGVTGASGRRPSRTDARDSRHGRLSRCRRSGRACFESGAGRGLLFSDRFSLNYGVSGFTILGMRAAIRFSGVR